jgi:predicted dithiol-disulfide oxidoreductase (DUF899 family)
MSSAEAVDRKAIEEEIDRLQGEVEAAKAKLAEARRKLPWEEVQNYTLSGPGDTKVTLSEAFGDKDDLLVIHNMGTGCSYCTLWADGFNGFVDHLENRAGFVVVSPNDPAVQAKFAASRGWRFKMLSGQGSDFTADMGFLPDGDYWPGVSAFHKDADGKIYRTGKSFLGPGDDYCAVWHLFDLFAKGADGWEPQFKY